MTTPVNADDWEEALIAGNGRQGALVYGGPAALRVTVSHERLFLPDHEPLPAPDTGRILDRLRGLCLAGEYQRAADEVVALAEAEDPRYGELRQIDPFVGAATLTFVPRGADVPRGTRPGDWRRAVDRDLGVVSLGQPAGVRLEAFVSRADDVVVIRLTGTVRGRLRLGPIAGAPPRPIVFESATRTDTGYLRATFPQAWAGAIDGYVTAVRVISGGARPVADGWELDTGHAIVLLRTAISPGGEPGDEPRGEPDTECARLAAITADWPGLLSAHEARHRDLIQRCRLDLPDDPAVAERFEAGRYAIICSTGDLPPTLQGVWSGSYDPPWRGGFTLDGNLATAVAALGPTGTPELLLPVFDLVEAHLDDFRDNAWRLYRAPGPLVPPHLSTHGRHNHFGSRWCLTFWTGGAGWLGRLYLDYWRYTGDLAFLADRAWPFLIETMAFYQHVARRVDGQVVLAPSYSPENSPRGFDGPQASVNATHEVAVIRDLASGLIAAAAALGRPVDPAWSSLLAELPKYQVGPDGGLREWLWPGLPDQPGHRHASHLWGLWYEPDRALLDDPRLRAAATATIRAKLDWWAGAGDEMAFGLVGLGLAAAALSRADLADDALIRLTRYWRASLVSTHNLDAIFNTDICGGLPALVVAMLAAGADDRVDLLPAAPSRWRSGHITGVRLRGGVQLDELTWTRERVTARVRCARERRLSITLRGGRAQTREMGPNPETFCWDTG